MSNFQIALVNKVPSRYPYFTNSTQSEITHTLRDLLTRISPSAGKFVPNPSWSLRPGMLQSYDVVIYFVEEPSDSVTDPLEDVPAPDGERLGGYTAHSSRGTVSEVYVDGNLPARRLANCAFHELMHNKLDVGGHVLANLHSGGGGGLASVPTESYTQLTKANIALMAKHLFDHVRQYTGAM